MEIIEEMQNDIKRLDGRIMLCCLQDYVKEVFDISGVGVLLPIFATNDEALNAFSLDILSQNIDAPKKINLIGPKRQIIEYRASSTEH